MNSAEFSFFVALLTAFYITVIHPFIVAGCIIALVGYVRYVVPKIDQNPAEDVMSGSMPEEVESATTWQQRSSEEKELRSEEENAADVHRPLVDKKKKSQREILAEVEAAQEREKYSKLLLTYQVPNMTAYYESLVRIIQQ